MSKGNIVCSRHGQSFREIGPLVTALLLSGRIVGSCAGDVATMQTTVQNTLLRTLGISPRIWTLVPALLASLIASPLLTMMYRIGRHSEWVHLMTDTRKDDFPPLRLLAVVAREGVGRAVYWRFTVGNSSLWEAVVEVLTPRDVPRVITRSVVIANLLIIVLAFLQMLLPTSNFCRTRKLFNSSRDVG
jgi:ABC-type transporter Mla maintaining outer membrane lipid asymmetry permease subunit MlaE